MQKEITEMTDILDSNGHVIQPGWARDEMWNFEKEKIALKPTRVKMWDFWEVFNDKCRIVLNIFDIGVVGVAQFAYTDFETKKQKFSMMVKLFTKGSVGNPKSYKYEKPLKFAKGKSYMEFSKEGDFIILKAELGKKIKCDFKLSLKPKMESISNLIPFTDPRRFVYAQKVIGLPATGYITINGKTIEFNEYNKGYGVLDWTRAVFPHKNHWYWCVGAGIINGKRIGFNIDFGFGTESSKSMIFVDGKGHHLSVVTYQHDWKDLNKPLKITSNDNRVNLLLYTEFIEKNGVDFGIIAMKGLSTFGYFTGELILDDGTKIEIKESDKIYGWAEEYYQKW
jgi:hypothetical protein